jgi:hypothetical protein
MNINDLRSALFETLNGIKSGAIDLDKARAINEVSKTIIDTAKVEVDYLKVNNGGESAFIEASQPQPLSSGIVGITRHVLKG